MDPVEFGLGRQARRDAESRRMHGFQPTPGCNQPFGTFRMEPWRDVILETIVVGDREKWAFRALFQRRDALRAA